MTSLKVALKEVIKMKNQKCSTCLEDKFIHAKLFSKGDVKGEIKCTTLFIYQLFLCAHKFEFIIMMSDPVNRQTDLISLILIQIERRSCVGIKHTFFQVVLQKGRQTFYRSLPRKMLKFQ